VNYFNEGGQHYWQRDFSEAGRPVRGSARPSSEDKRRHLYRAFAIPHGPYPGADWMALGDEGDVIPHCGVDRRRHDRRILSPGQHPRTPAVEQRERQGVGEVSAVAGVREGCRRRACVTTRLPGD